MWSPCPHEEQTACWCAEYWCAGLWVEAVGTGVAEAFLSAEMLEALLKVARGTRPWPQEWGRRRAGGICPHEVEIVARRNTCCLLLCAVTHEARVR